MLYNTMSTLGRYTNEMLVLLSDRNLDIVDGQRFADNRYGIV